MAFIASLVAATAVLVLSPAPAPAGEAHAPRTVASHPVSDLADDGERLFAQSCASCHGPEGRGTSHGPSLLRAGSASADFQLRTGRMPFTGQPGEQTKRKPPAFDDASIRALVAYVATIGDGPAIPSVTVDDALLPKGSQLFVADCAACHGATGNGGAVGGGSIAPPLGEATPVQVAEAMLTGPGQMPIFDLPDEDADAIVTYVTHLQGAAQPGGFEIGGIGPVPEGFVAWIAGMGALLLIVVLIGRDWRRERGAPDA